MTKHTDEFLPFAQPVTCHEFIIPRDEKSTDPKGWIRGNTKIGSHNQLLCKVNMEWKLELNL